MPSRCQMMHLQTITLPLLYSVACAHNSHTRPYKKFCAAVDEEKAYQ